VVFIAGLVFCNTFSNELVFVASSSLNVEKIIFSYEISLFLKGCFMVGI